MIATIPHQGIVKMYAQIDYFSEKVIKLTRLMGKNDIWIAATTAYLDLWLMTTEPCVQHLCQGVNGHERLSGPNWLWEHQSCLIPEFTPCVRQCH